MKVQATVLASALLVLAMAMPSSAQQQIQISPGDLPSQFLVFLDDDLQIARFLRIGGAIIGGLIGGGRGAAIGAVAGAGGGVGPVGAVER